jgi:hypothetical protein
MGLKFKLGKLVATRGVAELIGDNPDFSDFVSESLQLFVRCDWGDMTESDRAMNNDAVESGKYRIHGSYIHPGKEDWKIWIITEGDRSVTTILFPDEY